LKPGGSTEDINTCSSQIEATQTKNVFGWMRNYSAPLFILHPKLENSNSDNELGDLIILQSQEIPVEPEYIVHCT